MEVENSLYEIRTGGVGESYERCYCLAPNEEVALAMFEKANPHRGRINGHRRVEIIELVYGFHEPMITKLSDSGWEK